MQWLANWASDWYLQASEFLVRQYPWEEKAKRMWHNQVVHWSLGLTPKHHRKQISDLSRTNHSKNTSTSRDFPTQRHHPVKVCTKSHNSFLSTPTSTKSHKDKPPIYAERHGESLQCSSHFRETATVQINITTTVKLQCRLLIWIQCKLTGIQKVTAKRDANC
jgi:hypothetical protein